MSSREDRIAENEVAFRALNERISAWPENQSAAARMVLVCECGDEHCFERVSLTRAEYEAVRANARYFAVVAGHEKPGVERVVERHAATLSWRRTRPSATSWRVRTPGGRDVAPAVPVSVRGRGLPL